MSIENVGRVLDKDFEAGFANRATEMRREAQKDIDAAQKYMYRKNDEFEGMVKEHPKSFVLGAFMGGVLLGTLLSKGGNR